MIKSPSTQTRSRLRATSFSNKILNQHLERIAIVYVRQSSTKQVEENIESTQLQYQLVDRAAVLGWPRERIDVIDDDLGVSGKSIEGRVGFQRLLAEVSLEHVGIVLGIEMSRLARSCRDWHQLLELCAVFGTLLGDADGVYDPRDHNDRLLLGLKGTMSEAELHVLQGRLRAGQLNKARRAEYFSHAPIGYIRSENSLALEPDEQARGVVQLIFDKFTELGSMSGVLRYLGDHNIQLGVRDHRGPHKGQLQWRPVNGATLLGMLHHPVYAGAYVYGRRESNPRKVVPGQPGKGRRWAKPEDWDVLIRDKLPGYITWEQWEKNQQKLWENSAQYRMDGAPRGTSLMAGRVICGRCGRRMSISYSGQSKARLTCDMSRNQWGTAQCQAFNARPLGKLVEEQLLIALSPASIELSLQAAQQIESDRLKVESHHPQSVQRARYESALAQRRYEEVDPSNRLVAAELERRWESALMDQRQAEESLARFREKKPSGLTTQQRSQIQSLSSDIPALWHAETTSGVDRQVVLRALVEQIVVEVVDHCERVMVTIRWTGGFESHHEIIRAVGNFEKLESAENIKSLVIELKRRGYTHAGVAENLNNAGYRSPSGRLFTVPIVSQLCQKLRRKGHLLEPQGGYDNWWTLSSLAKQLFISPSTLNTWRRRGWVRSQKAGQHWVLWANQEELKRLKNLVDHKRQGLRKIPDELTTPCQDKSKST